MERTQWYFVNDFILSIDLFISCISLKQLVFTHVKHCELVLRKRPRAKTFQKALKSSAAKQQAPNAEILVGVKRLMIFWTLSRCSRSSFQTYPPAHFVFRPHVSISRCLIAFPLLVNSIQLEKALKSYKKLGNTESFDLDLRCCFMKCLFPLSEVWPNCEWNERGTATALYR